MPIQSFSQLRDILQENAREAFHALRRSRPGEHIYAFALDTDDDAIGASPFGSTEESLAAKLRDYPASTAMERIQYTLAFRWSPHEWPGIYSESMPASGQGLPSLEEMMEFMNAWTANPGHSMKAYRRQVFRAMVDALRSLDEEGLFGNGSARNAILLFISISDSQDAGFLEIESARSLNPRSAWRRAARTIPLPVRWIILTGYFLRRLLKGKLIAPTLHV
jgi:hypothetical protein